MAKEYVKINGAWVEKKADYVNINGTWVKSKSKYAKINGTWVTIQDEASIIRNLSDEHAAGRITIANTYLGDVETNISKTVSANEINAVSTKTDHLPVIKFTYSAPKRFIFDAYSNYLVGSYELGFGAVMFYVNTSGSGTALTLSAYEKRTYYSNNQVNNDLSVITKGTAGVNDPNHCTTTANRISAQAAAATSTFTFDLDVNSRTVAIGSHKIALPADFSYAYHFWISVHGWHSATNKTCIKLSNFRYSS